MKTCIKCGETKPKAEFYKDKNNKSGLRSDCKDCRKVASTNWVKKNPEKRKSYENKRRKEEQRIETQRSSHLKRLYGITLEQYNELFEEQQGCCAICGKHQTSFSRSLAVDHCHDTGRIRALLCSNCNSGIGKLKEDIEILQKAISYLKEHNE